MRLTWIAIGLACSACVGPGYEMGAAREVDQDRPIGAVSRSIESDVRIEPAIEVEPEQTDWIEIGVSVRGLPIRCKTVGEGPRRVLWVGGIHGNEREGAVATANLESAFRSASDLWKHVTLTIIEDINPDGSAAGTRRNANRVDLNRNFPAKNALPKSRPLSEPESRVLRDVIESVEPDTVLVAHSWGRKPKGPKRFINYDGPAERLASIFELISGYPVKLSRHLPPTPGSLGSWVGIDRQIPILTIEYMRGVDPELAWTETREAILAVIRG